MPPPPDRSPNATGSLAKTPFVHLLVYMMDRQLEGSILFVGDGGEHVVHFVRGAPAKAKTSFPAGYLGRVLLELGFIDEATHDSTLSLLHQSGELHGAMLVSLGHIERAQLIAGLRNQLVRRMVKLSESLNDATAYSFYSGVNLIDSYGGPELTPVDPLRVLFSCVRARPDHPHIDRTLARLGSAPVVVHPASSNLSRFGFSKEELGIIDLLKARPAPLAEILRSGLMTERGLRVLIYMLLITRNVALGQTAQAPVSPERSPFDSSTSEDGVAQGAAANHSSGPARATPVARVRLKAVAQSAEPPRPSEPEPASERDPIRESKIQSWRQMIQSKAELIEKEDYFSMLGVPEDVPTDVLQSAYFALAKQWHPDRLPPALDDVRDVAAKCFARMSEAFQTLVDPEHRAQYVRLVQEKKPSPDEQAAVQRIVEATIDFQKADVLMKKRDYAQAAVHARRALDNDPEQPEYLALNAWLVAQSSDADSRTVTESIHQLTTAINREPRCERAHFYRGLLLKRQGKVEQAVRDFRMAVELNPRNIDAAREVRLYEMRGGPSRAGDSGLEAKDIRQSQSKVPAGSFLSKLFKR